MYQTNGCLALKFKLAVFSCKYKKVKMHSKFADEIYLVYLQQCCMANLDSVLGISAKFDVLGESTGLINDWFYLEHSPKPELAN